MLDLYVIEEIRRQEQESEIKKEQPQIELPLYIPEYEPTLTPAEEVERGVCTIEL